MTDFEDRARCYKIGIELGDAVEDLGQLLEELYEKNPSLTVRDFSEFPLNQLAGVCHPLVDHISEILNEVDDRLRQSTECGVLLEQTKASWTGLTEALRDHKVKDAADIFTEFNRHLAKME